MKSVWKFQVHMGGSFWLKMPKGAEILHIGCGGADPGLHVWALCDPEAPMETTEYMLRGTGHGVGDDCGEHVATAVDGSFMWHIFRAARDWSK
jgi:hypothetical protein